LNYKLIIFDLDNTLFDEVDYYSATFREISKIISQKFKIRNEEQIFQEILNEFQSKGSLFPNFFDYIRKMYNLSENYHQIFYGIQKTVKVELNLYDDAVYILDWLKKKEFSLALITNGTIEIQKNKIDLLNLKNKFHYICIARELGEEKPSTIPYKQTLKIFNIKGDQAIYVGDNPYIDFQGSKELNIMNIRLLRGEFMNLDINNDLVDYFIKDYFELKEIIKSIK